MRADWFRFSGLEVADATLRGHYELDGRHFSEEIVFEGVDTLRRPALVAVAALPVVLWFHVGTDPPSWLYWTVAQFAAQPVVSPWL